MGRQKKAASFSNVSILSSVRPPPCEATGSWRWSNFLQSRDPPERERVLMSVDETGVRLVPDEGRGHVSKRACRLLVEGGPMGSHRWLRCLAWLLWQVLVMSDRETRWGSHQQARGGLREMKKNGTPANQEGQHRRPHAFHHQHRRPASYAKPNRDIALKVLSP